MNFELCGRKTVVIASAAIAPEEHPNGSLVARSDAIAALAMTTIFSIA
jgi:hypothetical protein